MGELKLIFSQSNQLNKIILFRLIFPKFSIIVTLQKLFPYNISIPLDKSAFIQSLLLAHFLLFNLLY